MGWVSWVFYFVFDLKHSIWVMLLEDEGFCQNNVFFWKLDDGIVNGVLMTLRRKNATKQKYTSYLQHFFQVKHSTLMPIFPGWVEEMTIDTRLFQCHRSIRFFWRERSQPGQFTCHGLGRNHQITCHGVGLQYQIHYHMISLINIPRPFWQVAVSIVGSLGISRTVQHVSNLTVQSWQSTLQYQMTCHGFGVKGQITSPLEPVRTRGHHTEHS
jgi:hypothetical protein